MASTSDKPPQFPFTRRHGVDPAPENAELRQKCPVTKVKLFDGSEAWVVMDDKKICETLAMDSEKLSAVSSSTYLVFEGSYLS